MSATTNIETNGQAIATATAIPASEPIQYAAAKSSGIVLPLIKLGVAGEAIRFAQQRLMAYGYRIGFNGQYGPQMKAAVEHFQAYYGGLDIDGIVGRNTWRALCNEEFDRLGWDFRYPFQNTKYPYNVEMPELGLGDKGDAVECLQLRLNAQGFFVFIDGDFGPKTLEAVKKYQRREGLKVNGIVGKDTWRKLG